MSSVAQEETMEVILAFQGALIKELQGLVAVFQEAAVTAGGGESLETVLRGHFSDVLGDSPNLLTHEMKFRPTQEESAAAAAMLSAAAKALQAAIGEPTPRR